jgi:hypothetical protein
MKKLLPLLLLACTGCGIAWRVLPSDDIYAMVSLRELPVGHVITQSEVMTTKMGISHRELLHPFRPLPDTEFTSDASKIIGHTVKTFLPAHRAISPRGAT